MAVLQMQKISICALKKDRKAVLEKLQRMKVMEISQILEEDPDFTTMDTRQERMELEKSASLSDQALEILDRYAPEKKSMFSALEGKALIEAGDYEKVVDQKEQLLGTVKRILALDKEKAEQKAGILKLENSMESLTPWMDLHVPMNYGGTAHTVMLIGTMPLATLEEIYQMLAQDAPEVDGVDVSVIYSDKDTVYLAVVCLTQDAEKLEEVAAATMVGGATLTKLLGTSAWYAPGAAGAFVVESILHDQKKMVPCSVLLEGEYGESDLCIGVPVILGKNGIEKIVELNLNEDEKAKFAASAKAVHGTNAALKEVGAL